MDRHGVESLGDIRQTSVLDTFPGSSNMHEGDPDYGDRNETLGNMKTMTYEETQKPVA